GLPALDLAFSFEESGSPAGARGSSLTLAMKKQVLRDYYPSGALRLESELNSDGAPDGCCREYFENGQLKVEHFSKCGRFHGRSRQWSEDGRLLGEFVCEHGSGVVT